MSANLIFHRLCRDGDYQKATAFYEECHDEQLFNSLCLRTIAPITYPFGAAIASDNLMLVKWFIAKSNDKNLPLSSSNRLDIFDFINHAVSEFSFNSFKYLCEFANYDGLSLLINIVPKIKDLSSLKKIYHYIDNEGKLSLLWNSQTIINLLENRRFECINWLWNQLKSLPSDYGEKDMYEAVCNFPIHSIENNDNVFAEYCQLLKKLITKFEVSHIKPINSVKLATSLITDSNTDFSLCQKIIGAINSEIIADLMKSIIYTSHGLSLNKLIFEEIVKREIKVNLHFNNEILFVSACSAEDYAFAKQIVTYCKQHSDLGLVNINVGKRPIFLNVCKKGHLDFVKYLIALKDSGHDDVLKGLDYEMIRKSCPKEIIDHLDLHLKKPANELDILKQDIAYLKAEVAELKLRINSLA